MLRERLQACEIASVDVSEMVWETNSNEEKTFHELQAINGEECEFLVPSTSKRGEVCNNFLKLEKEVTWYD